LLLIFLFTLIHILTIIVDNSFDYPKDVFEVTKILFIDSEATSSPIIIDNNDNYTIGSSDTSFDFNEDYEVDSNKYRAKAKRLLLEMYNTAASPELHIEKSNSSNNSKKKIKNKYNAVDLTTTISTATKNEKKINKTKGVLIIKYFYCLLMIIIIILLVEKKLRKSIDNIIKYNNNSNDNNVEDFSTIRANANSKNEKKTNGNNKTKGILVITYYIYIIIIF